MGLKDKKKREKRKKKRQKENNCLSYNTCGEVDKGTQMPTEDSERGGFPV